MMRDPAVASPTLLGGPYRPSPRAVADKAAAAAHGGVDRRPRKRKLLQETTAYAYHDSSKSGGLGDSLENSRKSCNVLPGRDEPTGKIWYTTS